MIKLLYEKNEYTIDDDFEVLGEAKYKKDIELMIQDIIANYDTSKGFEITFVANQLKLIYKIDILDFIDYAMEDEFEDVLY